VKDAACVEFLQWALPRLRMRWAGFRKVRRQVCRRVERRIRELDLHDVDAYRAYLELTPDEWLQLDALCHVTISRFYRDRGVFELLERSVLPELAADVEALGALEALAREGLPARGELRPFYIRLSVIAKRYLERRLGASVLEMTSAETFAFLRGHPHGGELLPVVRDLAEAADRIKFAKGRGLVPEAERHLASVRALVPALEARLRPAPPAETEGKAA